jgi:MFS transporter, FSR family, fosmidomycin resistance protein
MENACRDDKGTVKFEWTQLLALSAMNLLIAMFTSILPVILPVVRKEFSLSLTLGMVMLTSLSFVINGFQLLVGHMRASKTRPLLLPIGAVLAAAISLLAVLPRTNGSFPLLLVLAVISGFGIACTYPEAFRAVHSLKQIPPSISTAVYTTGSCIGGTAGGVLCAYIVSKLGLSGLYIFLLSPVICVSAIYIFKIKLAVETKEEITAKSNENIRQLNFWAVVLMGIPAATATLVVLSLLPTRLNEMGFDLTFGGFSLMIFGIGGAVGSIIWSIVAHRKTEILASVIALFLGFLFLTLYFTFYENKNAVWILFLAGFCCVPFLTLMITMARYTARWDLCGGLRAIAVPTATFFCKSSISVSP